MSQGISKLTRKLNRMFWVLTILAVAFLGLGYLLHRMEIPISPPFGGLRAWGIFLLLLSVILGVALPVLLRTLFNKKAVDAKHADLAAFVAHQKRLVIISISAAYIAGIAYLLMVPNLYLYGSVLAGLYGIYSAIPSERKLKGELRFYGLGGK
jgi:predicted secreted protein